MIKGVLASASRGSRSGWLALVWTLVLALVMVAPTEAADLLDRLRDQEIVQDIRLRVGHSRVMRLPFAISRVSIANPKVADLIMISEREIYLNGLAPGVTNISLWGRRRFTSATVTVEADVTLLKEKLYQILPQEKIEVKAAGDCIVLSGEVSSPQVQETALNLARAFASGQQTGATPGGTEAANISGGMQSTNVNTVPRDVVKSGEKTGERARQEDKVINLLHVGGVQQVMVAVRVAEINRSVGRRIGINFSGISRSGNFGLSQLGNLTGIDLVRLGNIIGALPGRQFGTSSWLQGIGGNINAIGGFTGGGILWTMFFDILKEHGLGRILAEPNLVATSGQEASFLAGGEYPIPVPQQFQTITIEYKKYGVGLSFLPTVLDNGKIALRVTPEVSELDFSVPETLEVAGYVVPALRVRRTTTHVEVEDGQTFAIAGLLADQHRSVVQKFPVLGNLPILGPLFRSSHYQKNETELVVLVTPHLVKPMPGSTARLPTDRYIEPTDLEFYLLGALEGRQGKPPVNRPPREVPAPDIGMQP